MKRTDFYLYAKKIHRFLVLFLLITGFLMVVTGLFMYRSNYLFFDPLAVRILHRQLSVVFASLLGLMAATGLYLFIYPHLKQPS